MLKKGNVADLIQGLVKGQVEFNYPYCYSKTITMNVNRKGLFNKQRVK